MYTSSNYTMWNKKKIWRSETGYLTNEEYSYDRQIAEEKNA